jgi:hypothetical protein
MLKIHLTDELGQAILIWQAIPGLFSRTTHSVASERKILLLIICPAFRYFKLIVHFNDSLSIIPIKL